jgi:hypothetical protein
MSWAAEEFKGIDLGDKRLNNRAILAFRATGGEADGEFSGRM